MGPEPCDVPLERRRRSRRDRSRAGRARARVRASPRPRHRAARRATQRPRAVARATAGSIEIGTGPHRDGGDGGTRPAAGAEDPGRRCAGEEQRREAEDQHEPGSDERAPPTIAPTGPATRQAREDRELGRRRTGQQVAGRDRVFELCGVDPPLPLDAQLAQQRDVRRWAAEPDAADPSPLRGRPCATTDATTRSARSASGHRPRPLGSASGGLEQLDDVAGGVVEQDLLAARSGHDVVAEGGPGVVQAGDLARRGRRR